MTNVMVEKKQVTPDRQRKWLLLLPPILWMGYFLLVYLLNEASCNLDFWRMVIGRRLILYSLVALVLTLLVLLALGYLGYQGWQLAQKEAVPPPGVTSRVSQQGDRFMGLSTVALTLFLALLTIGLALTFLVLPAC